MTAILAVLAILLAIVLIAWARVEVHGTQDLESLVADEVPASHPAGHSAMSNNGAAENEAASSRWATGFSH